MFKRVDKVLIGKDISRTASLVVGGASDNLAEGEIVVMDKNMSILSAGATIADTDTIYIIQGTGDLMTYYNPQGTAITGTAGLGVRQIICSDPIEGRLVKNWRGVSYAPKQEKTAYVDLTGWTPVAGTQYLIRIIYKDVKEHPGQFTATYRTIATTATLDTEGAALAAKVNADSGRRVDATYTSGTDVLLLTAKAIPECTTSLTDIDKFSMVDFDVRFLYVDSDGYWQTIASTSTTVTESGPEYGQGNWEQVRDLEKAAKGYIGFTNRTTFPVKEPTTYTVKNETYDLLVIEHDKAYQSPDNQYVKQTPLTTIIALPENASQTTNVLAALNPWLESCPGAFNTVGV